MSIIARAMQRRARVLPSVLAENPIASSYLVDSSTGSGVDVTPRTAESVSTVFACVGAISEDVAKLPVEIVEGWGRARKVIERDDLLPLLNHRPNPFMTAFAFRELLVAWALLWPGGVAEIVRNNAGRPVSLWPIPPWRWSLRTTKDEVFYDVQMPTGGTRTLASFDVLHLKGRTFDGIRALGTVAYARESMGIAVAADQMAGGMLGNRLKPAAVLKYTVKPDPKGREQFVRDIEAGFMGPTSGGGVLEMPFGAELTPFAMTSDDAEFLGHRKFQAEEICRWFRVPPHKVGILDRATFSNIEHQNIQYVQDTLQSWMVRAETEYTVKMVPSVHNGERRCEHDEAELLRGDAAGRMSYYSTGITNGIFNPNECRSRENMPPRDGGDTYLQPVNMQISDGKPHPTPAATPPKQPATPPPGDDTDDAADRNGLRVSIACLEGGLRHSLRACAKVAGSSAAKAVRANEGEEWAGKFLPGHRDHVVGAVMQFAEACRTLAKITIDRDVKVSDLAGRLADLVMTRTRNTRVAAMKPEDVAGVFEGSVDTDAKDLAELAYTLCAGTPGKDQP